MTERIRVEIDGDAKDLSAAAKQAVRAIDGVDESARRANKSGAQLWKDAGGRWRNQAGQFATEAERAAAGIDEMGASSRRSAGGITDLDRAVNRLNSRVSAGRNIALTLKLPALVSVAGMAADALGDLAGGAFAVGAASAPAAGGVAGLAAGVLTLVQAAGTAKLALGGVSEAIKAQGQAEQAAGAASVVASGQQEAAVSRVRAAKESLRSAQERGTIAQRGLTAARADARRELDELRYAADRSKLSEERAELSLREAVKRRREVMKQGGSTLDTIDADLSVREARAGLEEARRARQQATSDAAKATEAGVKGSRQVTDAQREMRDAARDARDATRDLADARRQDTQEAGRQSTAATQAAQAMAALPASAQAYVRQLLSYRPLLKELRESAADGLLPGMGRGLAEAVRNFPILTSSTRQFAGAMGQLAEDTGKLVGSQGFGQDFARQSEINARLLDRGGHATLGWARAAQILLVEAGPLTDWMGRVALRAGQGAEAWAENARETGQARRGFRETREVLSELGGIVGNVSGALFGLGKASYGTGRGLLRDFRSTTAEWEKWAKSREGQHDLRVYFHQAGDTVRELGRLVADVGGAWARLSGDSDTDELVRKLRTTAVPALERMLDVLSNADGVGGALVELFGTLAETLAILGESGGGLHLLLETINAIAKGFNALVGDSEELKAALGTGLAAVALYKVLGIGAALKGLDVLIGKTKTLGAATAAAGGVGAGKGGKAGGAGALARATPWVAAGAGAVAFNSHLNKKADSYDAQYGAGQTKAVKEYTAALAQLQRIGNQDGVRKLEAGMKKLSTASGAVTGSANEVRKLTATVVRAGDPKPFDAIAYNFKQLNHSGTRSMRDVRAYVGATAKHIGVALGTGSKAGEEALRENFRAGARHVKTHLDAGTLTTRGAMREIRNLVEANSDGSKDAARVNFAEARRFIEENLTAAQRATKRITGEIRSLMVAELKAYGYTDKQARGLARNQEAGRGPQGLPGPAFAQGGFIGSPGMTGGDSELAHVGNGEAVVNGKQQGIANTALAIASQVAPDLVPYGSLDEVFQGERTPHWAAGASDHLGTFARGGRAFARGGRAFARGGGNIVSLGKKLQKQGIHVSEHPAFGGVLPGVHSANGWHYKAGAVDLNVRDGRNEPAVFDRLAPQLKAQGWNVLWRVKDHFDHMHVDVGGGGGGLAGITGAAAAKLKLPKWDGPGGTLGAIGKAGTAAVGKAAQASLDAASAAAGVPSGDTAGGGAKMGDSALKAVIGRALKHVGWDSPAHRAALYSRVMQESGGNPRAVNNWDINAKNGDPSVGLAQVIGSTFAQHRDPRLPNDRTNPMANLVAALRYMRSRYGRVVGANGVGYARGGRVRRKFARGKPGQAGRGRATNRLQRVDPKAPSRKPAVGDRVRGELPRFARQPMEKTGRDRLEPFRVARMAELEEVPELNAFEGLSKRLAGRSVDYGNAERAHGLTEETPTRSGPAKSFSDDQLLYGGVYDRGDVEKLRLFPDTEVEVLSRPDIDRRVGELDELIQIKGGPEGGIATLLLDQEGVGREGIRKLAEGIAQRRVRIAEVRARAEENIARIKRLMDRLKAIAKEEEEAEKEAVRQRREIVEQEEDAEKEAKKQRDAMDRAEARARGKDRRALERENTPKRKAIRQRLAAVQESSADKRQKIRQDLDALHDQARGRRHRDEGELKAVRGQNVRLIGTDEHDVVNSGGQLRDDVSGGQLEDFKSSLEEWDSRKTQLNDGVADIPQQRTDVQFDVQYLVKDREAFTAKPPRIDVAPLTAPVKDPEDPAGAGAPDDGGAAARRAELAEQMLSEATAQLRAQGVQLGAVSGMMSMVGGRYLGAFAHGGPIKQTGLALLHAGEYIVPDPRGPYGMNGSPQAAPAAASPVQIVVVVDRDGRARATVDGQAVDVMSRQTGQRTRALIAAPGGSVR